MRKASFATGLGVLTMLLLACARPAAPSAPAPSAAAPAATSSLHEEMIAKARQEGEVVVAGSNADEIVKEL